MMSPVSMPLVRHVMVSSLWRRRFRSGLLFLAGYSGVWAVVGLGLGFAVILATQVLSRVLALALAFGVAAAWQLSPPKRRALRRCALTVPLAAYGWRADRDCVRYGVIAARSCVMTCWAFMAAAGAGGHHVLSMAVIFWLQVRERMSIPSTALRARLQLPH